MGDGERVQWSRLARVNLNGHQDLGLCRVDLDPDVGMLRCETLTDETPRVSWVTRNSIYMLEEVTSIEAEKEIAEAASERADAEKRRLDEIVKRQERLACAVAKVTSMRAESTCVDEIKITWSGDVSRSYIRDAVFDHMAGKGITSWIRESSDSTGPYVYVNDIGKDGVDAMREFVAMFGGEFVETHTSVGNACRTNDEDYGDESEIERMPDGSF